MADRIEREIEEILKKIDDLPERPKSRLRKPVHPAANSLRWLSRINMRKVMIWALFAVLVAVFLRGIPGGYFLLIGAILVFVTAFVLSTRGGGGSSSASPKRWRGQPMDLTEPAWPDKLKAWWKSRKRV
ncbi:MAG TPA: hypothetical protein VFX19_02645 [Dehalococcoidia bacterium]|jgi:hypothetical protein|nr:hypothetical protein [Dehalococcoidia bacterium]